MAPVREGQMMPGMVPTVLEIPIRMAAYLGATSRWFTPNPAQVRPPRPRASERKVMEVPRVMIRAVRVMNSAWQEIIVVRVSFVVKKLNTENGKVQKTEMEKLRLLLSRDCLT